MIDRSDRLTVKELNFHRWSVQISIQLDVSVGVFFLIKLEPICKLDKPRREIGSKPPTLWQLNIAIKDCPFGSMTSKGSNK
jgi:hypothetical protein